MQNKFCLIEKEKRNFTRCNLSLLRMTIIRCFYWHETIVIYLWHPPIVRGVTVATCMSLGVVSILHELNNCTPIRTRSIKHHMTPKHPSINSLHLGSLSNLNTLIISKRQWYFVYWAHFNASYGIFWSKSKKKSVKFVTLRYDWVLKSW